MPDLSAVTRYDFPWPNDTKGYAVFPAVLEDDPLVAFHGTAASNLESIVQHGFKIQGNLPSISFAKGSSLPLGYACSKRDSASPEGVVIAVRFQSLAPPCVVAEVSCIYLYCQDNQPEIIGYCMVPANYVHS